MDYKQTLLNIDKSAQYIYNLTNFSSLAMSTKAVDFYHDAINSQNGETIENILVNSMLDAIPNMFDTKIYVTYNRNYFETNESHQEAKRELSILTKNSPKIVEVINYINKHFFKINYIKMRLMMNVDLGMINQLLLKLRFIFSELLLNILKNVSHLKSEERSCKK